MSENYLCNYGHTKTSNNCVIDAVNGMLAVSRNIKPVNDISNLYFHT